MARNTDHRADDLDTDNTGGVLSGLLAEEDDLDRRALWRLGSWGVGAVAAVIVAVMANQTQLGWKRDQMASADLSRQTQQVQMVARENQNEARRLASAIDTLNNDRDRLYARVTGLEQGLDSVTGAIARQGSTAPVPPTPLPAAEPQAAQGPAPAVAAVATTPAGPSTSEKPAVAPPRSEPASAAVSSIAKDPPRKESAKEFSKGFGEDRNPEGQTARRLTRPSLKPPSLKPPSRNRQSTETARTEAAKVDAVKTTAAIPNRNAGHAADGLEIVHGAAGSGRRKTDRTQPNRSRGDGEPDPGSGGVGARQRRGGGRGNRARRSRSSEPSSASISAPPIRFPACARSGAGC